MDFTTQLASMDVNIDGRKYKLVQADGDKASKWRNAVLDCMILGPDGMPKGSRNLANTESLLVSLCLHDESGDLVDLKTIRSWPNTVVAALFREARRISGLDDTEEQAKNELSGTVDGSA